MPWKCFWPDATQTLLLGVGLHRDPVLATQAWRSWKERIDLDELDAASFQIMSLICWRLLELGLTDPDLPRIKGLHRYRWTQNQLAARGKLELLRALQRGNFPTLVLGGAALASGPYPSPTARGLQDTEIVLRKGSVTEALRHLEKSGWLINHPDIPRVTEFWRGHPLVHPQFGEIYLFWQVMAYPAAEQEEEFWQASQPFDYNGVPTRRLSPTDQFIYCCEQGIYHPSVPICSGWRMARLCSASYRRRSIGKT